MSKTSVKLKNHQRKRFDLKAFSKYRWPEASLNGAIERFYTSIGSPVALSCLKLFQNKQFDELVTKTINPLDYTSAEAFRDDYAAISFLRKAEWLKTTFDPKQEALKTFAKAEAQCKTTNSRFRNLAFDPLYRGANVALLHAMTRKISSILGEFDVDEFFDLGAFGPGSSLDVRGDDTSATRKFKEERKVSLSLYQLVGRAVKLAYPQWDAWDNVEFCEFSNVITVPKNARTHRTIAVEPGLNIWFQKALGLMIRRRLRRNGLNLATDYVELFSSRPQKGFIRIIRGRKVLKSSSTNELSARLGSLLDLLATVDFSSASDTIAARLIEEVTPPRWFAVLNACRSRNYRLNGKIQPFEKFSSMGNGFTFELESLIFFAAALACCEYCGESTESVSVFGDDVILPSNVYACFASFASFLGFTVNPDKSFASGMFRESCGSYWFGGADVKPLFLKKRPRKTEDVFNLANQIRTFADRGNISDKRFKALHGYITRSLPPNVVLFGEKSSGIGTIWSNFDQVRPAKSRHQLEGFSFKSVVFPAVTVETDSPALLLTRLHASSDWDCNTYPLRKQVRKRISHLCVHTWYDFGPWSFLGR